jgi:hypothetical protein
MVGRGVRAVRCGRATAGAAPSATGTVVRRILTGTCLSYTPAAQQGHLGEDLYWQITSLYLPNPILIFNLYF